MKPDKLLDGMQHISPEYITEAKPAPKQQTEDGIRAQNAAGTAETVNRSHASEEYDTKEKDYIMKKNTMIRRITTGFAAAAACAVFACGGWFICQQARQQQEPEPESTSVSETAPAESSTPDVQPADTNFLGGQGQLHVLRCRVCNEGSPADVLYDDTRWYFRGGASYAERFSENGVLYYDMPAEKAEFYTHVLYDECGGFFYADGQTLCRLENDGTLSDEPFFALNDFMLADGADSSTFVYSHIIKMSDTDYLISMTGDRASFIVVYHADGSYTLLRNSERYDDSKFLRSEEGTVYVPVLAPEGGHSGIVSISADGSTDTVTGFSGTNNYVENMAVRGGLLCVVLASTNEEGSRQRDYAEIDIALHNINWTKTIQEDQDSVISSFITVGAQDYYIKHSYERNVDVLCRIELNPSGKRTQELLTTEGFADTRYFDEQHENSMMINIWADEKYIMMELTGQQYVLFDTTKETQTLEVFNPEWAPADEPEMLPENGPDALQAVESDVLHVDESQYTELDPGFTGTNFLGGQGSLHIPKKPGQDFLYDDTNYYFYTLVFPRSGNHCEYYDNETGYCDDLMRGGLISDGERLYVTKNGAINLIDSSGTLTPFFRLSDAGMADNIRFTNVFRIGSSYLFCWYSTPESYVEKAVVGSAYGGYIWVDENGMLLGAPGKLETSEKLLPGSPDSSRSNYVYLWDTENSAEIRRLADPASGEEPLDFTLPDWQESGNSQYGRFSAVVDDKFLYLDKNGAFCGYEPDTGAQAVLVDGGTFNALAMSYSCVVIDEKIYYMLDSFGDPTANLNLMQYDLNSGERKKLLSFDTDSPYRTMNFYKVGSKLMIPLFDGPSFCDPETGELFRLYGR